MITFHLIGHLCFNGPHDYWCQRPSVLTKNISLLHYIEGEKKERKRERERERERRSKETERDMDREIEGKSSRR